MARQSTTREARFLLYPIFRKYRNVGLFLYIVVFVERRRNSANDGGKILDNLRATQLCNFGKRNESLRLIFNSLVIGQCSKFGKTVQENCTSSFKRSL